MNNSIKKLAAINDLSGMGRVALTTIIPILSSMGIQVCPFPTEILPTHPGGFKACSFVDLTDSMRSYMKSWKDNKAEFDCIYSGFLASTRQVDIVIDFIKDFKRTSTMVVVDPVMGDHGKLYSTMDRAMVYKMRSLINKADIITPNLTEALYLLGEEDKKDISEAKIKDMLIQLASYGPRIVIVTSAPDDLSAESINIFAYDREEDEIFKLTSPKIPIDFPGTGDTFTSVLIGEILNGRDLYKAVKAAMDFVFLAIEESVKFTYPSREGILLEKVLWRLNA